MKKIVSFLFIVIIATASYGNSTNDSDRVIRKVIVENSKGRPVKIGEIVTFTSEFKINDNLMPNNSNPYSLMVREPEREGDLYAALLLMKEGEIMEFTFNPQTYFGEHIPPTVTENDAIYVTVNMLSVLTEEEFMAEEMKKEEEKINAQIKEIEKYMADNNLNGERTESGLYYILITEGTGPQVEAGKKVTVHYTGTLIDGTKFDSSYDRNQPFEVVVGERRVIKGWDEGLQKMKVGEKCKLIIPSVLGYGEYDMGVIPPNSILIFDMEILKVE
jgi:FKBP-type peptidyl-prolyl cis-trans isomerase